jgi:hypothetical protein
MFGDRVEEYESTGLIIDAPTCGSLHSLTIGELLKDFSKSTYLKVATKFLNRADNIIELGQGYHETGYPVFFSTTLSTFSQKHVAPGNPSSTGISKRRVHVLVRTIDVYLVLSPHSLTYSPCLTHINPSAPASLSFREYPLVHAIRRPRLPKCRNSDYATSVDVTIRLRQRLLYTVWQLNLHILVQVQRLYESGYIDLTVTLLGSH